MIYVKYSDNFAAILTLFYFYPSIPQEQKIRMWIDDKTRRSESVNVYRVRFAHLPVA